MPDRKKMTRADFIAAYGANGPEVTRTAEGITIGDTEMVALPCQCGEPACRGWAMLYRGREEAEHRSMYGLDGWRGTPMLSPWSPDLEGALDDIAEEYPDDARN